MADDYAEARRIWHDERTTASTQTRLDPVVLADVMQVPPYLLGIGRRHRWTWRLRRRVRITRRRLAAVSPEGSTDG